MKVNSGHRFGNTEEDTGERSWWTVYIGGWKEGVKKYCSALRKLSLEGALILRDTWSSMLISLLVLSNFCIF